MALAIWLRSRSSRLTENLRCLGVTFRCILLLKARSNVLFAVVDAVVELSNVVVALIGSAVTMYCFYLNLKLGREEKPRNIKLSISSIGNKQNIRAVDIWIFIPDTREKIVFSRTEDVKLYVSNPNY